MALGWMGHKKGMTQIFGPNGEVVPVTVVEMEPAVVVQKKTKAKEGYDAIQIGFHKVTKTKRLNKPQRGLFEKKKLEAHAYLKEFRVQNPETWEPGMVLDLKYFQPGDIVDVEGITKGRGFQGVIKRHGKHGGPDSHGSDFHRRPGSIGMRTWPGRVLKNMRLPGRMGQDQVKIRHLPVVEVRPEENVLMVRGAIPGTRGGSVILYNRQKGFEERFKKKEEPKEEKKE